VVAATLFVNWLAHGSISPPYAHRELPGQAAAAAAVPPGVTFREGESWNPANWYDYAIRLPNGKLLTSYWRSPQGVDRGEPSAARYAFHALVGHHGVFSLTPAWLLVPPGLAILLGRGRTSPRGRRGAPPSAAPLPFPEGSRMFAGAIAAVSLVVVCFYLARPPLDRNYGGVSSGFRWVFWLAPLWVAATVPAADRLGRGRLGRLLALVLLGGSVLSVAAPTWTPWTQPWLERLLTHAGWIRPS
jgi:hypothetical protein